MSGRVLVAGASIAGPALAHCLRRHGFEVTVVERAPAPRPGGQAVDVRGVAKEVLRRIGLDEAIRAACTDTEGASQVNANNRRLVSISADDLGGDGFIAEIEILRGDLSEVLYDATKDGVEYLFGDRIAALDEDAQGVAVRFDSGAERRFDLVVGADGLHSGLRAMVFGPHADHVHHLGHYLAFYTVPNHLGLDRWALNYSEPGRTVGIRSIHDNRDAMAYFGFRAPGLDLDHRDVEGHKRLLRERMAGMRWEVPYLLERLDDAPDFYLDQCAQVRMDSWSRGRVALLGDSAFCPSPLSGQGTSLAMVGAYVLAGELAEAGGDHTVAFPAYQRRMRGYVEANQKMGRDRAKQASPDSRLGLWVERQTVRILPHLPARLLASLLKAVNAIELPDYPVPAAS
jgi:2-polyprenyl-6-methoxyphenol hydroxylase-like FAD-dependent oxidoreductase